MKISILLFVFVLCMGAYAVAKENVKERQSGLNNGRYQLFQGEYKSSNLNGTGFWRKALFKIDTDTGEIFICEEWHTDAKNKGHEGKMIEKRSCRPFEKEIMEQINANENE